MRSAVTGLETLLADRSIVVCCGPGGVGKTTVSGALALQAARSGRRAIVVTVDPARRLADALGVGEAYGGGPGPGSAGASGVHLVDGPWSGELWATMLDARGTFDNLVRRYAPTPAQGEAILSNRFYRNLAGSLSGTQEYMAMERLFELHDDARYDIVIVDTPPTRNALDFLDAPRRLAQFLDSRAYRVLMMPARTSLKAVGIATAALLRNVSRVVGSDVISEASAFFQAFEGMEEGFRQRSKRTQELMLGPETAFVLVTGLRPDTLADAGFLAERLRATGSAVDALIANRTHPLFGVVDADTWDRRVAELANTSLAAYAAVVAGSQRRAEQEEAALEEIGYRIGAALTLRVPELDSDVADLDGIGLVADALLAAAGATANG